MFPGGILRGRCDLTIFGHKLHLECGIFKAYISILKPVGHAFGVNGAYRGVVPKFTGSDAFLGVAHELAQVKDLIFLSVIVL